MDFSKIIFLIIEFLIVSIGFLYVYIIKHLDFKKHQTRIARQIIKEEQEKNDNEIQKIREQKENEIVTLSEERESLRAQIEDSHRINLLIEKNQQAELEKLFEEKRKNFELELEQTIKEKEKEKEFQFNNFINKINEEKEFNLKEIELIKKEIIEYQDKRHSINEEILRQRAIEQKNTFYQLQITPQEKEDINFLLSIESKLTNKTLLRKLIWSEFLIDKVSLLLKNQFGINIPKNVIYMIKNEKDQKIYIGKTKAEVSKRWTEHIKSSLEIGTLSNADIHKALFNHWEDFSFSIIEEVKDEDKLGDREKYYIKFYESNIYGFNLKEGG